MLKLGVIGTGGIANWHAQLANAIPGIQIAACCDIRPDAAKTFAEKWKMPVHYSDYRELLESEKLDAILNATTDDAHCEVALAALQKKLHILSEKPLATSLDEARSMLEAAKIAGVINMVNFSYRNSAGLQEAAKLIADGGIGELRHVESSYLQGWLAGVKEWDTTSKRYWRLSTSHGSAGVLGDLGCHIYDMTTLLCGDIDEIYCKLAVFDKGVPGNRVGEYIFDANDSFVSQVTFRNGAIGTVHSTRWAAGQKNSLRCRVYGTMGAVEVDLDSGENQYKICRGENLKERKWETVEVDPTPSNWERFVKSIQTGSNDVNDFANGFKIQAYLHYSIESDLAGAPVTVRF